MYELPRDRLAGPVFLVTAVGAAQGSKEAAAALACGGSEPDRAGLLIDLAAGRGPRPSPIATAAARMLEERLAAHLPDVEVASRGATCRLGLAGERDGDGGGREGALDLVAAAAPLARDSATVVHLPPSLLQPALEDPRVRPTAALLRADLPADRALTALAARDLVARGLRLSVLERPLGWLAGRLSLLGALPVGVIAARSSASSIGRISRLLGAEGEK